MTTPNISFSHPHDHFNLRHTAVIPNTCFVLMPFDTKFTIVWDTIQEALDGLMVCKRADDITLEQSILERILNGIRAAELIIADLSGRNPNVFYELGIAHVQTKSVLLIVRNINDVPFDLRHLYCHTYDPHSRDGLDRLADTVRKAAEDVRKRNVPEMLEGAQARTRQIVDYMERELSMPERLNQMVIRIQAGFTSLGNLGYPSHNDPVKRAYGELLLQECDNLVKMIEKGATLQAVIFPPVGPCKANSRWCQRYAKLLAFLEERTDLSDRCEFAVATEEGPNLFFFGEDILFEGHKTGIEAGYGWTMVYTDKRLLRTRLTIFDMLFQSARRHTLLNYRPKKLVAEDRDTLRRAVIKAVELARDGRRPRRIGVKKPRNAPVHPPD